jgi:N-6 DNA Methylase
MESSYSLSPDVVLFRNALYFYCRMTSFITVVHMLFDTVVMDFLCENNEEMSARLLSIDNFMDIFHVDDNFLKRNIPFDDQQSNANENLEAFTWYYRSVVISDSHYRCDLSVRFHSLAIHFRNLEPIESILSIFYTKHFLNVLAKEQQKDHGQFYTPIEVIRFMWDRVLIGKGNGTWTEKLLGQNLFLYPNQTLNASSSWGILPKAPSVLDPCMGIGSFLCEFIDRLTLAAQQCPIVWNNSRAISILLHSLSENLWGIEIDAFAYHLCKINITLHILPLYKRFLHLTLKNDLKLARFHLFCNDTLNLYLPKREHTWEYENLSLLRSPQHLKFDFIVTNPPHKIKKTGFIVEADSKLFDEQVLGKARMQAYAYFFWFCVERCQEEIGEVCLISGKLINLL